MKKNTISLPDNLKSGIESLSGHSMDDVKVHYNSASPAQLESQAYAEGSNIIIDPGSEKHQPYKAWHVVQQKEERIKSTLSAHGKLEINNDEGLENEADIMGTKALQLKSKSGKRNDNT